MGRRRVPQKVSSDDIDTLLGKPVDASMDLHGVDRRTAEMLLEAFLARWSSSQPGAVVRVITGRGNRSGARPVLRPLVRELLEGRLSRYVRHWTMEAGSGAYLVQVR